MDLKAMEETIYSITTKQKLFVSNSQEIIDELIQEIQQASSKIQTDQTYSKTSILEHLKTEVNDISSHFNIKRETKYINRAITKYTKLLDTCFNPDISKAYRNVEMDSHTVNQVILTHFYQQGQFNLGDLFVKESSIDEIEASVIRNQFWLMNRILQSFRNHELKPALTWIAANRDKLKQQGINLELKLRRLEFLTILQKQNGRIESIKYAKEFLTGFPSDQMAELRKIIEYVEWAAKLEKPTYSGLLSSSEWENVGEELKREYFTLIGRSERCPMITTIAVGMKSLPILLKMMKSVIKGKKKEEWEKMKELPIPVELDREFEFHTIFICPICRDQANCKLAAKLSCGHIFCLRDVARLWYNAGRRPFNCPFCTALCVSRGFKVLQF